MQDSLLFNEKRRTALKRLTVLCVRKLRSSPASGLSHSLIEIGLEALTDKRQEGGVRSKKIREKLIEKLH